MNITSISSIELEKDDKEIAKNLGTKFGRFAKD